MNTIFNDVSLEFEAGRLYTILGRTLSGKTSFLKTIAGLQPVDEGEITLDEKDFRSIPVWERNVASGLSAIYQLSSFKCLWKILLIPLQLKAWK